MTKFKFLWKNLDKLHLLIFYKFLNFWNIFPEFRLYYKRIIYSTNYIPILLLSIFGTIISIWRRKRFIWVILLLIIALQISILIYFGTIRLRNPLEPIIIIFAAYGINYIFTTIKERIKTGKRKSD